MSSSKSSIIALIVLAGIAVAIWYLMSQNTELPVDGTAGRLFEGDKAPVDGGGKAWVDDMDEVLVGGVTRWVRALARCFNSCVQSTFAESPGDSCVQFAFAGSPGDSCTVHILL